MFGTEAQQLKGINVSLPLEQQGSVTILRSGGQRQRGKIPGEGASKLSSRLLLRLLVRAEIQDTPFSPPWLIAAH